jgi:DNA-binding MarR family transcriptional regulator
MCEFETQMPKGPPSDRTDRFAYQGLDRVIHERARLGVLTSLATHPKGIVFSDLGQLCGLTPGNLSRHLQVLQKEGIVEVIKRFEGNRPQTLCRLTRRGRERYLEYLEVLEQVIRDAAAGMARAAARGLAKLSRSSS